MKKISFNEDWYFYRQGDSDKRKVTLPHDAQIIEKRGADVSDGGHGYFPGGVYVYKKTFIAPAEWKDKKILAEFEGVYKNCTVSLNGTVIGGHKYGYTTFTLPLENLNWGGENIITVVADNSKLPNSRWYSGSGIYRPVWLYVGEKDGIAYRGLKITTLSIHPAKIRVEVNSPAEKVNFPTEISVSAESGAELPAGETGEIYEKYAVSYQAAIEILDGSKVVARGSGSLCEIEIPGAKLWSDESPNLYTCRVTLTKNGEVVDAVSETFGIREIKWSPKGLFINGKETLLRGGCIHHDNGVLGAAAYDESEWRRVRILKEAGFNALRMAHNPCSRAMLEACDYFGLYVMDETFDMWYNRKTKFDYGNDFEDCWKEDTAEMVERDYNHTSVILYSIGNEVAEPFETRGVEAGRAMVELIHSMDASRPVTCGLNLMIISRAAKGRGIYKDGEQSSAASGKKQKEGGNASLAFNIIASFVGSGMNKGGNSPKVDAIAAPMINALDIAGYNYGSGRYPLEEKQHPERIIFGSETFPQDICKNWAMVKKYPYLIGDFMWTAWDYLGEAGIGAWSYTGGMPFNRPYPWVLGGAGVIDIIGIPDGSCRYASTVWGLEKAPRIAVKPVNHPGVRVSKSVWRGTNAIESWAWAGCEGNKAEVEVYSDADAVELLVNGRSMGKKKVKECRAIFKTKYASGTLAAVAYAADGRELARRELKSATGKTAIAVKPEVTAAKSGEVVYVPVEIVGENGVVESNADRKLKVTVTGGELLGFGSANPCHEEQYHTGSFTTYYGRALAVVRVAGDTTVSVTDGKNSASAQISCKSA